MLALSDVDVLLASQEPELAQQVDNRPLWPRFLFHAPSMQLYGPLFAHWPYALLLLVRRPGRELLGWLETAPAFWDGTEAGLPAGWDHAMAEAVQGLRARRVPDALAMLSLSLKPHARGAGLGPAAIEATRRLAAHLGVGAVIAPVRPTGKARHPRVPMRDYIGRTRTDGLPEDAWLRTHVRAGGRVLGIAQESTVMEAPLACWQEWAGRVLPAQGEFTLPGALAPVQVLPGGRSARYAEPNVWVSHRPLSG